MGWRFFVLLSSLVLVSLALAEDLHGWKVVDAQIEEEGVIKILNEWDLDVWSYDSRLVVGSNRIFIFILFSTFPTPG